MKLKKLSVVFATLAIAAFLIMCGGLLAMYDLHLPGAAMLPQSIAFALYMIPVLITFAVLTKVLAGKRQSH